MGEGDTPGEVVSGRRQRARVLAATSWRSTTAGLRPWPDFVILGGMRCGTSSLYRWLSAHPQVTPATKKELNYFDVDHAKGQRWYRSHFPLLRHGRITGEASPYMLFYFVSPERVARELPETKLIALLRNPVERAISHYWFSRKMEIETEPLETAIRLEPERLAPEKEAFIRGGKCPHHRWFSYLARGEYASQLERWFAYVGRERILVLESEKVFSDPDTRALLTDWLGVAPSARPFAHINRRSREPVDPALLATLEHHFEPHNEELFALLGTRFWGY
jgi:hypothetical protein